MGDSTSEAFRSGQRWISASEPELGLGQVRVVSGRTITLEFKAANERRQYVAVNAPLRRAAYRAADTIRTRDGGVHVVEAVVERDGLLHYRAGAREIAEFDLHDALSFGSPLERLYAGQFDPPKLFELRRAAIGHQQQRLQSEVHGLLGGRIDLLPHQLSIASEVTSRLAPRVLLADEVGLGKTIEACLILHRLILTGRASRVLIVVPETLVHQWFVELLRRFSLWFHIFSEGRAVAIEEATPDANPFLEHQLVLCDPGLLLDNPVRLSQALDAGWDVLVVDEAHHLQWTPESSSPAYDAIAALGQRTPGLLLMTATPEQLGMAGHFARLRLLDPHRFHDLDAFVRESESYREVAARLDALRATESGDSLAALLDRHGTGRVMFRNTRDTVTGFPARQYVAQQYVASGFGRTSGEPGTASAVTRTRRSDDARARKALAEEWRADTDAAYAATWEPHFVRDPRAAWLVDLLRTLDSEKVLLICRSQRKAVALESALRGLTTIPFGVFHEGMTLVQRDRSAAWFAEPDGARLLICSEIGSEGRNFQFAHHLVLFDLPLDPGLLEQRIGRLDRIGQRSAIQIHVPVIPGTHLEVLARWYHEGVDAFTQSGAGGRELMEQFAPALVALVAEIGTSHGRASLDALVHDTAAARVEVARRLDEGRDRLLELNSFKPAVAERVIGEIREQDADESLDDFMLRVFDHFFIEVEQLAPRTWRLGSAGVLRDAFPGLSSDGVSVTADRARALVREEQQFLTWDHPLVSGALDLLLGGDHGNCGAARWIDAGANALYLEGVFVLECVAPASLHVGRFLPPTAIRVVVDHRGRDASAAVSADIVGAFVPAPDAPALVRRPEIREGLLPKLVDRARLFAEAQAPGFVSAARTRMESTLQQEEDRLRALRAVNPSVREDEIQMIVNLRTDLGQALDGARLRLDAVRLIHRGPGRF